MNAERVKEQYEKRDIEFFFYQLSREMSYCPLCGYPAIVSDEDCPRIGQVIIVCVNGCFKFMVRKLIFNKYTMDNVMELYKLAIEKDDKSHTRFLELIDFGGNENPHIGFTCYQCVVDRLQQEKNNK